VRSSAGPRSAAILAEMSRFFFIVVEIEEDPALIRLMESPLRLAATLQLPDGCRLRTSFEIGTDYANVIINM
jgi:hypothetical protein